VDIARARVPEGAVEDVVQDAMTIVFQKVGARGTRGSDAGPLLPWCFQVLRNVIGNHYQRERTRSQLGHAGSAIRSGVAAFTARGRSPTPIEALEASERSRLLHAAIRELSALDEFCGRYFVAILDERKASREATAGAGSAGGAGDAAGAADDSAPEAPASSSTPYVRSFRCRRKLRKILLRMGYRP